MMRAFIFLCFFGWAAAAEKIRTSFDCQGCYLPMEGFNTKSPSSREPEKEEDNHVHVGRIHLCNKFLQMCKKNYKKTTNGTWAPVENELGFPPKPVDQKHPAGNRGNQLTKKICRKEKKHSAAPLGTRHRRRASPPTSNWNPLQSDLGFKTEENENQLNATAVVPKDGSNTTTNSSTVIEDIWHPLNNSRGFKPMGNEDQTNEGNAQTENSKLIPDQPTMFWHPLNNRPGFPTEGTKDQKEQD